MCGKIQCQSSAKKPQGTNTVSIDTTIRFKGREVKCRGTFVYSAKDDQEDLSDPGLVLTGTKCGDGMVSVPGGVGTCSWVSAPFWGGLSCRSSTQPRVHRALLVTARPWDAAPATPAGSVTPHLQSPGVRGPHFLTWGVCGHHQILKMARPPNCSFCPPSFCTKSVQSGAAPAGIAPGFDGSLLKGLFPRGNRRSLPGISVTNPGLNPGPLQPLRLQGL